MDVRVHAAELIFRQMLPADLCRLALQPSQIGRLGIWQPVHNDAHGRELVASGPAWAAIRSYGGSGQDPAGDVLCLAGFAEVYPERQAIAWALIGGEVPLRFHVRIAGFMRLRLAEQPYRRIEAIARAASLAECNWLRRLGFVTEGVMRDWGPLGEDHVLFRYRREGGR